MTYYQRTRQEQTEITPAMLAEWLALHRQWLDTEGQTGRRFVCASGDPPCWWEFPGVDLRGADLRKIYWEDVRLPGAILTGANLSEAELIDVDLDGAILDDAQLSAIRYRSLKLAGMQAVRLNLSQAQQAASEHPGGFHASGAVLVEAKLAEADLRQSFLDGALLVDAQLQGTDLRWAHLESAQISPAQLAASVWDPKTPLFFTSQVILPLLSENPARYQNLRPQPLELIEQVAAFQYSLSNVSQQIPWFEAMRRQSLAHPLNLTGLDLSGMDLCGVNLRFANLEGANLAHADLRGAALYGANLRGAILAEANLNGAQLSEANLQQAEISGLLLRGARARHVDFSYTTQRFHAEPRGVNLRGALIRDSDFTHADLRNASLRGTSQLYYLTLQQTDVRGADLSGCPCVESTDISRLILDETTILPTIFQRKPRE